MLQVSTVMSPNLHKRRSRVCSLPVIWQECVPLNHVQSGQACAGVLRTVVEIWQTVPWRELKSGQHTRCASMVRYLAPAAAMEYGSEADRDGLLAAPLVC
jgi:hypothetical protein